MGSISITSRALKELGRSLNFEIVIPGKNKNLEILFKLGKLNFGQLQTNITSRKRYVSSTSRYGWTTHGLIFPMLPILSDSESSE